MIYLRGPSCCPAIVEVTRQSKFLPKESNRGIPESEWGRWPWLTRVKMVTSVPLERAISPKDIDLNPIALQNGRKQISREQYEIAEIRLS